MPPEQEHCMPATPLPWSHIGDKLDHTRIRRDIADQNLDYIMEAINKYADLRKRIEAYER